jgi:hypothetical protein
VRNVCCIVWDTPHYSLKKREENNAKQHQLEYIQSNPHTCDRVLIFSIFGLEKDFIGPLGRGRLWTKRTTYNCGKIERVQQESPSPNLAFLFLLALFYLLVDLLSTQSISLRLSFGKGKRKIHFSLLRFFQSGKRQCDTQSPPFHGVEELTESLVFANL